MTSTWSSRSQRVPLREAGRWSAKKIAMRTRHEGGARWLRGGENADQPAPLPELAIQPVRHDFGRAIEDDRIVGRVGRIALGGRRRPYRNIRQPKPGQNIHGLRGQRRIALGRRHLPGQMGNDRRRVAGRAPHHQDVVTLLDLGRLQHLPRDHRLDQIALVRSPLADIEIEVEIGQRALAGRGKSGDHANNGHQRHRAD